MINNLLGIRDYHMSMASMRQSMKKAETCIGCTMMLNEMVPLCNSCKQCLFNHKEGQEPPNAITSASTLKSHVICQI